MWVQRRDGGHAACMADFGPQRRCPGRCGLRSTPRLHWPTAWRSATAGWPVTSAWVAPRSPATAVCMSLSTPPRPLLCSSRSVRRNGVGGGKSGRRCLCLQRMALLPTARDWCWQRSRGNGRLGCGTPGSRPAPCRVGACAWHVHHSWVIALSCLLFAACLLQRRSVRSWSSRRTSVTCPVSRGGLQPASHSSKPPLGRPEPDCRRTCTHAHIP